MLDAAAAGAAYARTAARSNVFLAATLEAAGRPCPVRVRNISRLGALLDGPDLPDKDSAVILRRGSLSASADIAWRDRDQCGVRFTTAISVGEWIRRVGHPGQEQVDTLVRLVRSAATRDQRAFGPAHQPDSVAAVSHDLSEVCDRLANVPLMVESQCEELLRLDVIAQRLRQLLQAADGRR